MILVTAEEFGYGPVVTAVYFLEKLRTHISAEFIFAGKGISLIQAQNSKLFSKCIKCDLKNIQKINEFLDDNPCVTAIISFENPESMIVGVRRKLKTIYIDNLFWLWKNIPEELKYVDNYIMVDSLNNLDENLNRIGVEIQKKTIVGPLRDIEHDFTDKSKIERRVLIGLGGADSYMMNKKLILNFYNIIISQIGMVVKETLGNIEINICGGNKIIESLKHSFIGGNYNFHTMCHKDFINLMEKSKYVFLSPGLGNFLETFNIEQEVCLLPPINYSQYLQCEAYKKMEVGIRVINWNDMDQGQEVPQYLEEYEGVKEVEKYVKKYLEKEEWLEIFSNHLRDYINEYRQNWKNLRQKNHVINNDDFYGQIVDILE